MVPKSSGMGLETAPQPQHKGGSKDTPSPPAAAMSPAGTKHQGLGKGGAGAGINK